MPPSTARAYVTGRMGSYNVPDLVRTDSCLRELRHRLAASGPVPQMLPRIWHDIDALLDHRWSMMDTTKRHLPADSGKIAPRK